MYFRWYSPLDHLVWICRWNGRPNFLAIRTLLVAITAVTVVRHNRRRAIMTSGSGPAWRHQTDRGARNVKFCSTVNPQLLWRYNTRLLPFLRIWVYELHNLSSAHSCERVATSVEFRFPTQWPLGQLPADVTFIESYPPASVRRLIVEFDPARQRAIAIDSRVIPVWN